MFLQPSADHNFRMNRPDAIRLLLERLRLMKLLCVARRADTQDITFDATANLLTAASSYVQDNDRGHLEVNGGPGSIYESDAIH